MRVEKCLKCGRILVHDEIAIHKKLFNRAATEFMCRDCCAEHFGVSVDLINEKIRQYKEMGCTLFEEK